MARWKWLLPSLVSSIDAEASMTSATSRRLLASKRFRFRNFSIITNPVAARSKATATTRMSHRAFTLLSTNEPPNSAMPMSPAGRTNNHGMLESGGMKGRASANASKANNKQRAAISNRSSHSILRRRIEMVSNRNRMAPHSMGFAACWRTRWMMIGIVAATRPARSHGLRNNIGYFRPPR